MLIRNGTAADDPGIEALTRAAFAGKPYADDNDPLIPARLRTGGDLLFDLVGEIDGAMVAHVAFSPAMIGGGGGWATLGPVSVVPARQKQGLGGSIIRDGLDRLRALGLRGCVLVGDPGYYGRFGFRTNPGLSAGGIPAQYIQALSFAGAMPVGEITFAPAFTPA